MGIFPHSLTSVIAAVSSNDIRGTQLLCAILLKAIQIGHVTAILRERFELLFFLVRGPFWSGSSTNNTADVWEGLIAESSV